MGYGGSYAKGARGKATDCAYGKPAKNFQMAPKPGAKGSNPGGKHLSGSGDSAYGQSGKGGGSVKDTDKDGY